MPDQPAQQSRFPANRIFNIAGALMGCLLMVIGIAICAAASEKGIDAAREFILGLYMAGFCVEIKQRVGFDEPASMAWRS